jgi:hypothetical protein
VRAYCDAHIGSQGRVFKGAAAVAAFDHGQTALIQRELAQTTKERLKGFQIEPGSRLAGEVSRLDSGFEFS